MIANALLNCLMESSFLVLVILGYTNLTIGKAFTFDFINKFNRTTQ